MLMCFFDLNNLPSIVMKRSSAAAFIVYLAVTFQIAAAQDKASTVVAVIGDRPISLLEFEQQYVKSTGQQEGAPSDSPEAYEDFLERYVDFRLKILEAERVGYPDRADVQNELHEYRASFARPYLIDREVMAPILADLYRKKREVVHASHIMVRLSMGDPTPQDTLAAWNRLSSLVDSVNAGVDFGDLAFRHSEDPSAQNEGGGLGFRGDLGWFTAGRMVKAFEDRAYSTPVGDVSEPFRTPYGYHILKVHARQKATAGRELAHIMVRFTGDVPEDTMAMLAKMDSIVADLQADVPFEVAAARYSEDPNSRTRGGQIGVFRDIDRQLDQNFYNAAFGLESEGDVSDVVQSAFGYHLIKLIRLDSLGTFEQEYDELEREARNLPRMRRAEATLAESARDKYPSTLDTLMISRLVGGIGRDSLMQYISALAAVDSLGQIPIATLADSVYTLRQILDYAEDSGNPIPNAATSRLQVVSMTNSFLDYAAITHAALDLEQSDEEFAEVMRSFRDGLIMFELMDDSVWTAATSDSMRMLAHFEKNSLKYVMPERYRLIEVECHNDSLLARSVRLIDEGMSWAEFEAYADSNYYRILNLDTVMVAGLTNSVYDQALQLEIGERTDILPIRNTAVVLWKDGIEQQRPKTYEEAQAEIVSELQQMLEEALIARLRREYDAQTFPDRIQHAFK